MWSGLRAALDQADEDWDVWIAVVRGTSRGAPRWACPLERAWLQLTDEDWEKGPAHANRRLKEEIERLDKTKGDGEEVEPLPAPPEIPPQRPAATSEQIAAAASPQPFLTADGKLDAGPNSVFDGPDDSEGLATLPIRQQRLIESILPALHPQAPKILAPTLVSYRDELKARGTHPILGLLQDMAMIIMAAVEARTAEDEWLDEGSRQAFDLFAANHVLLVQHFPREAERERLYVAIEVDEEAATGEALSGPAEKVAKAAADVHAAGLTTSDFVAIVNSLTELTKAHAFAPPAPPSVPAAAPERHPPSLRVNPADRSEPISAKKRSMLNSLGFWLQVLHIGGSTASIVQAVKGIAFLSAVKNLVEALRTFIGF